MMVLERALRNAEHDEEPTDLDDELARMLRESRRG
jgi:hypothetical protein